MDLGKERWGEGQREREKENTLELTVVSIGREQVREKLSPNFFGGDLKWAGNSLWRVAS